MWLALNFPNPLGTTHGCGFGDYVFISGAKGKGSICVEVPNLVLGEAS